MTATTEARETIRDKLEFLTDLFTCTPAAAHVNVPTATAILESGLAFRTVNPDGSSVATDMPVALGGAGSAPSPGWLLSAAMASCYASVIALRSAEFGVELTRLEVSVDADGDVRGLLGIGEDVPAAVEGFKVLVSVSAADVGPYELQHIVHGAIVRSPVVATARNGSSVEVEVEIA